MTIGLQGTGGHGERTCILIKEAPSGWTSELVRKEHLLQPQSEPSPGDERTQPGGQLVRLVELVPAGGGVIVFSLTRKSTSTPRAGGATGPRL